MSAAQNWLADLGDAGRGGEAGMDAAEQRDAQDYAGEDEMFAANVEVTHREVGILHSWCDPDSPWPCGRG